MNHERAIYFYILLLILPSPLFPCPFSIPSSPRRCVCFSLSLFLFFHSLSLSLKQICLFQILNPQNVHKMMIATIPTWHNFPCKCSNCWSLLGALGFMKILVLVRCFWKWKEILGTPSSLLVVVNLQRVYLRCNLQISAPTANNWKFFRYFQIFFYLKI